MTSQPVETLEAFRARAKAWISSGLTPRSELIAPLEADQDAALQAKIFDAGFAGLAVPKAYGGQGLTLDHQRVWADEARDFVTPSGFMVSIGMMMPTLLDHGTEAAKRKHIPRMLRGDERWIQLLSEPGGGSDMAGALTRATRTPDGYVINGSKMWSSGADTADYGLCLARLDWDAPKHRGLAMFAMRLKSKGVSISPIIPVTGGKAHFFIEYFDDVEVPADYLLGGDCDGWTVAQRLLFHERNATAGVGFGIGMGGGTDVDEDASDRSWQLNIPRLAEKYASLDDPALAGRIADDHIARTVSRQLAERINAGMRAGKLQGPWGSLLKLGMGIDSPTNAETALAVSGADGVIWSGNDDGGDIALNWLRVRGISIAGGSNEIQRNIVSERLLELPREPGEDKDAPFSELLSRRQKKT